MLLQEKAHETEKYMSDLTVEMDKVRLEKSKLEERNQLLETVLSLSKQDMPLPTKGILQLVQPDPLCCTISRLSTSTAVLGQPGIILGFSLHQCQKA